MTKVKNVIFIHGAWANASCWARVLPLVEQAGLSATAAQMPLTSLAEDAATLGRAIALVDGPLLLVGHSYSGSVITEAGGDPKVAGLVYVTGFGPDAGESPGSLGAGGPPTPLPEEIRPDAHGFLKLTRKGIDEDFAQDLSAAERAIVFATQGPIAGAALGAPITSPAWKQKPSWYLFAEEDRAIHPELQRTMAARMGATTASVASSHLAMLSHPEAVADIVVQAAG